MVSSIKRVPTRTLEETSAPRADEGSRPDEDAPPAAVDDDAGGRVGRYVLLERIGAGGMGVVFAAYDPELDRKVAVKLLADRKGVAPDEEERERLIVEAQALARLNHPNVVTVHDVGVAEGGRVFVAMEYVRGDTLGAWASAKDRPWREVVQMLVATGRGLAAAHEEQIVHRDFKPDNVLVERRADGRPGRPRVLAFGMAMQVGDSGRIASELEALDTSFVRQRRLSSDSGQTGVTLAGTPAYMSPEQYLRMPGDARSDQFSFCVTAWELLYGARPFVGVNRIALATAIVTGTVPEPPGGNATPSFVERALRRGLHKEPGERWPSMAALLEALSADPGRKGRRAVWLAGGALGLGAAGWMASRPPVDVCAHGDARAGAVWNDDARASVRAAFRATGLGYAEQTAASTVASLDAYATGWRAGYRDACEATHVRREQSARRLDVRMACLATGLEAMQATAVLMQDANAAIVENAAAAVVGLPPLAACEVAGADGAGPEPPPEALAAEVRRIRARAAELSPLAYAGRVDEARTELSALLTEAEAVDYVPLHAELRLHLGHAQSMAGKAEAARATLRAAAFEALTSGHDEVQASAASLLIRVEGLERSDYDTALLWAEHARAAVARVPEPGRIATLLEYRQCRVLSDRGDVDGALPHCEAAVARFTEAVGPEHIDTLSARQGLGIAYYMAGRLDDAEPTFRAAYDASVKLRGPEHPSQAVPLQALAAICYARDRGAECVDDFERAYQAAV
ncbi:MAG: serine/threonine-protein kinase, partial [Myxococcota bacterium]